MILTLENRKKLEDKLFSYYISYYNAYNKRNQVALDDTLDWIEKNINLSFEQFWDKLTLNLDVKKKPTIKNLNDLKIKGVFYIHKSKKKMHDSPWNEGKLVFVARTLDKTKLPGHMKNSFLNWAEKLTEIDKEKNKDNKIQLQKESQILAVKATNRGQRKSQDLFDKCE